MMDNLLALLKRIEASEYMCVECCAVLDDSGHHQSCQLKAHIDKLEAENKIKEIYAAISNNLNDQRRILNEREKKFDKNHIIDYGDGMKSTRSLLREWFDNQHRNRLMEGMQLICEERNLDPAATTIKQFMELK